LRATGAGLVHHPSLAPLVWRTTPCSVARLTVPRDPQTIFKPI
jgi:hypothetical protein